MVRLRPFYISPENDDYAPEWKWREQCANCSCYFMLLHNWLWLIMLYGRASLNVMTNFLGIQQTEVISDGHSYCKSSYTNIIIIRPNRSTTYVDKVYCYRRSNVVCWFVCHTSESCKNGWTDRDAVCVEDSGGHREPENHVLDGVQIPPWEWQFWRVRGVPL